MLWDPPPCCLNTVIILRSKVRFIVIRNLNNNYVGQIKVSTLPPAPQRPQLVSEGEMKEANGDMLISMDICSLKLLQGSVWVRSSAHAFPLLQLLLSVWKCLSVSPSECLSSRVMVPGSSIFTECVAVQSVHFMSNMTLRLWAMVDDSFLLSSRRYLRFSSFSNWTFCVYRMFTSAHTYCMSNHPCLSLTNRSTKKRGRKCIKTWISLVFYLSSCSLTDTNVPRLSLVT